MLYVPLVLGAVVAGKGLWRVGLLAVSATCAFVGRESVLAWWRGRTMGRTSGNAAQLAVIYLAVAGIVIAPLVFVERLLGMLVFAGGSAGLLAWNALQAAKREERTILTELIGIAGLTLTAPAAFYAGAGRWGNEALWLWLLSGLYFASSVFYVKLRVLSVHARQVGDLVRIRWLCGAYHAGLTVFVVVAVITGKLLPIMILAFAPVVVRAFWHIVRPGRELVLRRIGVLEIVYSLAFLVFAAVAFRAG